MLTKTFTGHADKDDQPQWSNVKKDSIKSMQLRPCKLHRLKVLHGGRELMRTERDAFCFTLSHLVCEFPWPISLPGALGLCVGVACLCFVSVLGCFLASRQI